MQSVEFFEPVIFQEVEHTSGMAGSVHHESLNVIFDVISRSSREAGEQYAHGDLEKATLRVSKNEAVGCIDLSFLTNETSYNDGDMEKLKDWV